MLLYLVTNLINNKQYVGQTIRTLDRRWYEHRHRAKSGSRVALHAAIRKYGVENFKVEVLAEAPDFVELGKLEEKFINEMNTLSPNGYNQIEGGKSRIFSEELRKKMGGPNHPNFGKCGPAHPNYGKKGPPVSDETRALMSANMMGNQHLLGHKHSEDTKAKMSAAHSGEKHHSYGKAQPKEVKQKNKLSQPTIRPVYGFNKKTGIGIYLISLNSGKVLGFDSGHISKVCRGKSKKHRGFVWSYVE